MCYIFLIDCQFAIFYRTPPRLTIVEMTCDLTCSEKSFAAEDRAQCEQSVLHELTSRTPSLATCCNMLLHDLWPGANYLPFQSLTILNLFTLISGTSL